MVLSETSCQQMLAGYFGSAIEQHLWRHPQSTGRCFAAHTVNPLPEAANYATKPFDVNSHHHQGVFLSGLSDELVPLALAETEIDSGNTLVEAFKHHRKPIMAVQWHPEEWFDEFSCVMMKELL